MGWRGTDVLAAVRLRVQPADQARLQGDVAVFAVFSNQASVELTQGDHDAVWVVVRIRLLPGSSLYSSTRTRSFSKTTLYLSGAVCVGSATICSLRPLSDHRCLQCRDHLRRSDRLELPV